MFGKLPVCLTGVIAAPGAVCLVKKERVCVMQPELLCKKELLHDSCKQSPLGRQHG